MGDNTNIRIGLVVMSDRASAGVRPDGVEGVIREFLAKEGADLAKVSIIPDEADIIGKKLVEWADSGRLDLVLTSGGTGVSPRDVTPEATCAILQQEIPGIPEAMRAESLKITNRAVLSRGVAGIRNGVMIVNLPGSPKAALENLACVYSALLHGVAKAQGDKSDCAPTH